MGLQSTSSNADQQSHDGSLLESEPDVADRLLLDPTGKQSLVAHSSFFSPSFFFSSSSSFSCPFQLLPAFHRRTRYCLYSIHASRGIVNVTLVNLVLNFFSSGQGHRHEPSRAAPQEITLRLRLELV